MIRPFKLPKIKSILSGLIILTNVTPSLANNISENSAWQFETMTDKANRAFIEDMRQKKQSGYYASPVYNTYIDRQYNCAVSSVATGNQATSNAVGNSPTASGHSVSSTGNTDTASLDPGSGALNSTMTNNQLNRGEVEAEASGEIETSVRGDTYQALNTDQQNSGTQTASVTDATACSFLN